MPAAPPKPRHRSSPFGDRLRKAREVADLRLDEASVYLRQIVGSEGPSRETIRRYERGLVPESEIPAIVIAGMATIYNVDLRALSPLAADRIEHQLDLISFHPRKPTNPPTSRPGFRTKIRRTAAA
jgi:transcriptional regulator with XRE-family HTH domain